MAGCFIPRCGFCNEPLKNKICDLCIDMNTKVPGLKEYICKIIFNRERILDDNADFRRKRLKPEKDKKKI